MTAPRHPLSLAAANCTAAAFRAKARGMTRAEALALQEAEAARIPGPHPLRSALDHFAREIGLAHGNAGRVSAAADALLRAARFAFTPQLPERADIHG